MKKELLTAETFTAPMECKFVYNKYNIPFVQVNIQAEDGEMIRKTVSLENFTNLLNSSVRFVDTSPLVQIGEIPHGYIDGAVSSDGKMSVLIHMPAQKTHFFSGGVHREVAFPGLVFGFAKNKDDKVTTSQCFSVKGEELSNSTHLYLYPYGNVSHTGGICWGNGLKYATISHLKDFEELIQIFFDSETFPHYYEASVNTGLNCSHGELVALMEQADHFPEDMLKPADITLGELKATLGIK